MEQPVLPLLHTCLMSATCHMPLTPSLSIYIHQYGNIVLPCEDNSSESVFYSKWAYELSTALQLGNAEAIYNIPSW